MIRTTTTAPKRSGKEKNVIYFTRWTIKGENEMRVEQWIGTLYQSQTIFLFKWVLLSWTYTKRRIITHHTASNHIVACKPLCSPSTFIQTFKDVHDSSRLIILRSLNLRTPLIVFTVVVSTPFGHLLTKKKLILANGYCLISLNRQSFATFCEIQQLHEKFWRYLIMFCAVSDSFIYRIRNF